MALEDNQSVMSGGTETEIMQQELNTAIVSALEQLTGLQFPSSENLSKDDIQKVVKQSREWWKAHQKEIKQ